MHYQLMETEKVHRSSQATAGGSISLNTMEFQKKNTEFMIVTKLLHILFFFSGVCNTDNFSLLSITIDYGPFGFMGEYNPSMNCFILNFIALL